MGRVISAISAASLLAIVPAGAANAQAPLSQPAAVQWRAGTTPPFCTLNSGDPGTLAVSIHSLPGGNTADVYLSGAKGRVRKLGQGSAISVQLLPSGEIFPAHVGWDGPIWKGLLILTVKGAEFIGKLKAASGFSVQNRSNPFAFTFNPADPASRAFQDCLDRNARHWGVDPVALAALRARPNGSPSSWLTYEDYPIDAVSSMKSGTTVVRLTTDASGKVTNCAVVYNSGSKSMGDVTCRAALKRAKYAPAIAADGKPTAATFTTFSKFQIYP